MFTFTTPGTTPRVFQIPFNALSAAPQPNAIDAAIAIPPNARSSAKPPIIEARRRRFTRRANR